MKVLNFQQARGSREAAEPVIRAKKSNKVRPSSVNYVDSFPPRGSREAADNFQQARGSLEAAEPVMRAKKSNKVRPSSVNYVDSFPPRGSREAADNFCRRK